jgi:hypothetical protein
MRSRGRGGGFTARLDTTRTGDGECIIDFGGTLAWTGEWIASGVDPAADSSSSLVMQQMWWSNIYNTCEDEGSSLGRQHGGCANFYYD